MKTDNCDFIKVKTKKLETLITEGDNEAIHSCYDEIIKHIALKNDPLLTEKINKMVEDVDFWFA